MPSSECTVLRLYEKMGEKGRARVKTCCVKMAEGGGDERSAERFDVEEARRWE